MSPFSHFLYDPRVRRQIRQVDLAERIGYERSYISALEAGLKGPPTQEFVDRLNTELKLSDGDGQALQAAADASQRRFVLELDMPQDVYWLINRLRETLPALTPTQGRVRVTISIATCWRQHRGAAGTFHLGCRACRNLSSIVSRPVKCVTQKLKKASKINGARFTFVVTRHEVSGDTVSEMADRLLKYY